MKVLGLLHIDEDDIQAVVEHLVEYTDLYSGPDGNAGRADDTNPSPDFVEPAENPKLFVRGQSSHVLQHESCRVRGGRKIKRLSGPPPYYGAS